MKARLWQTLFILNALITSEIILAEDAKKDVRDLKEQNIMSVLFQQTAAERLAGSLQTFRSAKQALDNALADSSWSALPGQIVHGKRPAIIVDVDETVLDNTEAGRSAPVKLRSSSIAGSPPSRPGNWKG